MDFIKGFFREGTKESMTRLCMFLTTVNALAFMWFKPDYSGLILGTLGLVFTLKSVQNGQEIKNQTGEQK